MRKLVLLAVLAICPVVAFAQFNVQGVYQSNNAPKAKPTPANKADKIKELERERRELLKRLAAIDRQLIALGANPNPSTQPASDLGDGSGLMTLTIAEVQERYGLTAILVSRDISNGVQAVYRIPDPDNERQFFVDVTGVQITAFHVRPLPKPAAKPTPAQTTPTPAK